MKWLNLELAKLRSPEYIGSDPVHRATWLSLTAYCAEQENGGIIRDCAGWKSRMWEQSAGVTKEEVSDDSMLWKWDGSSVKVWAYPAEKEAEVQAKREGGYVGGKASGKARKEASRKASIEPQLKAELKAELERNGMEGKGSGKEVEGNIPLDSSEMIPEKPDWAPTWNQCRFWLADVQKNGANYTEPETNTAFLALNANGWMWGKNPVVDWRSAIESRIQTDRNHKPTGSKPERKGMLFMP